MLLSLVQIYVVFDMRNSCAIQSGIYEKISLFGAEVIFVGSNILVQIRFLEEL